MKLETQHTSKNKNFVTSVCWLNSLSFLGCCESQIIDQNSDIFANIPSEISSISSGQVIICGSVDGKLYIISKKAKITKVFQAHKDSVLCSRLSPDNLSFATSGEDGTLKIWSSNGMLRSTLVQEDSPIYCFAWNPTESKSIVLSCHKNLMICSLEAQTEPIKWKAHDGSTLSVDWSRSNFIVSGGEDCKYKIWDTRGNLIFQSELEEHVITSINCSPVGDLFVVGTFNTLRLCRENGISCSLQKMQNCGILATNWSPNGSRIGVGCSSGHIVVVGVTEKFAEWKNLTVLEKTPKNIKVKDLSSNNEENLEFQDNIVTMSINFDRLVVVTPKQCFIYNVENWNTPIIIKLRDCGARTILQSKKLFGLVDETGYVGHYYDGRILQHNLPPNYKPSCLATLSDKFFIFVSNGKEIVILDSLSGQNLKPGNIYHKNTITRIHVGTDNILYFLDHRRELHVLSLHLPLNGEILRLASSIDSFTCNQSNSSLVTISEEKLSLWLYPGTIFINKSLVGLVVIDYEHVDIGVNCKIRSFMDNQVIMENGEGATIYFCVSMYSNVFLKTVSSNIGEALRLARFINVKQFWAVLAVVALINMSLEIAQTGFLAIKEADKGEFCAEMAAMSNAEAQKAAFKIFCGDYVGAQQIYMKNNLVEEAILMNVKLHKWDVALEMATKHPNNIDLVLNARRAYLESVALKETIPGFVKLMAKSYS